MHSTVVSHGIPCRPVTGFARGNQVVTRDQAWAIAHQKNRDTVDEVGLVTKQELIHTSFCCIKLLTCRLWKVAKHIVPEALPDRGL